jgi:hypothetical protein
MTLAQVGYASGKAFRVAAVLVAVLDSPSTIGRTVDLIGGDTPVAEAVAAV